MFDELGIEYSHGEDYLPLTVKGSMPDANSNFYLRGNVSSQFITGLLLAMGAKKSNGSIYITTPLNQNHMLT